MITIKDKTLYVIDTIYKNEEGATLAIDLYVHDMYSKIIAKTTIPLEVLFALNNDLASRQYDTITNFTINKVGDVRANTYNIKITDEETISKYIGNKESIDFSKNIYGILQDQLNEDIDVVLKEGRKKLHQLEVDPYVQKIYLGRTVITDPSNVDTRLENKNKLTLVYNGERTEEVNYGDMKVDGEYKSANPKLAELFPKVPLAIIEEYVKDIKRYEFKIAANNFLRSRNNQVVEELPISTDLDSNKYISTSTLSDRYLTETLGMVYDNSDAKEESIEDIIINRHYENNPDYKRILNELVTEINSLTSIEQINLSYINNRRIYRKYKKAKLFISCISCYVCLDDRDKVLEYYNNYINSSKLINIDYFIKRGI